MDHREREGVEKSKEDRRKERRRKKNGRVNGRHCADLVTKYLDGP